MNRACDDFLAGAGLAADEHGGVPLGDHARLLEDPATDPDLARRLALSQQARDFASTQLSLMLEEA